MNRLKTRVRKTHLSGRQVFHSSGDLIRKRHEILLRQRVFQIGPDRRFVTRRRPVLSQEIPEVAVLREFHQDEQRPVLCAAPQQVDDVHVFADHFHHFHLRHQIHHFGVGVSVCKTIFYTREQNTFLPATKRDEFIVIYRCFFFHNNIIFTF